jgi:hypothetical protein
MACRQSRQSASGFDVLVFWGRMVCRCVESDDTESEASIRESSWYTRGRGHAGKVGRAQHVMDVFAR